MNLTALSSPSTPVVIDRNRWSRWIGMSGRDRRNAHITLALTASHRVKASIADERADAMASALKIQDIMSKYPQSLSGGQAQRCALARAMVLRPTVFLLDEITSALDPTTIMDVIDAIRALRLTVEGKSMAVLIVTHLMHFAETFADRIAFLHNGKILEELPARLFFRNAQQPETLRFLEACAESR